MLTGEYAIWDANLHHNDLRPFACPQVICEGSDAVTLYPLPECCCASFDDCADPVKGFCQEQHFYIEDCKLMQATTDEVCEGGGCCAGVPKPPPPVAEANEECESCTDDFDECYATAVSACDDLKAEADALAEAYFECKYQCDENGEEQDCDAEFDAWQDKLEEYNDCMACQREAVIECYETPQDTDCPCDGIAFFYVITYTTSHAGIQVEGTPSIPSNAVVSGDHIPNATVSWDTPPEGYCIVAVNIYRVESEFEDGTTQMPIEGKWANATELVRLDLSEHMDAGGDGLYLGEG